MAPADHHANQFWYDALNNTPGRVGPPIEPPSADIRQYFRDWMDRDGHPFWPFWENVRTWWAFRHLPNVLFVHFANLKRDMPGQMHRIADFLDVPVDEARWEDTVEYYSFDWMKRHAAKSVPLGGAFWDERRPGLYKPRDKRPLGGDPHARGRRRVRAAGRHEARPRVRAVARHGEGL